MSSQGGRVVQTDALPPNTVQPLEAGASNVFQSAALKSDNQNQNLNTLINGKNGQNGGIRRRRTRMRGGANGVASNSPPVVVVAGSPSYDTSPKDTDANYMKLAGLANTVSSQAALDKTVGGTQADAALISAKQQAVYNGTKGGSRRRRTYKKGGSFPSWGCFSGGKKTRRHKKSCKCKKRKTCKHLKRYHHH